MSRHILVTGGNRGIGLAIVNELLSRDATCHVWLGSRKLTKAQQALLTLPDPLRCRVHLLQLDVENLQSIQAAFASVAATAKNLYAIVNNAGVAYDLPWDKRSGADASIAQKTLAVNFHGVVNVTRVFLPLLHAQAESQPRIIVVSSGAAASSFAKMSTERRTAMLDASLTLDHLNILVQDFCQVFEAADERPSLSQGWWLQAYGFSKAAVNAYVRILARQHPDIFVAACTPGFVDTEMVATYDGDRGQLRSAQQGADTPVWLTLSHTATQLNSGAMVRDRAEDVWVASQ